MVSLGTVQYYLKYRERRGHKPWHPDAPSRLCHGNKEL